MKSHYSGKGAISFAFPTPVLQKQFPDTADINDQLLALVLEREMQSPSVGRSNIGGWHSGEDLFEWPGPAIAKFREFVAEGISEISQFCLDGQLEKPVDIQMDGGAWANLCRNGSYNKIHNHPDCTWSGVYYVTLGDTDPDAPPEAGKIEFLDPRMGATDISPDGATAFPKMVIDPKPGMMVIFPCWLYHYVNPFQGRGERLSIAFNIRLNFEG